MARMALLAVHVVCSSPLPLLLTHAIGSKAWQEVDNPAAQCAG